MQETGTTPIAIGAKKSVTLKHIWIILPVPIQKYDGYN
jgi:hypothetical protein